MSNLGTIMKIIFITVVMLLAAITIPMHLRTSAPGGMVEQNKMKQHSAAALQKTVFVKTRNESDHWPYQEAKSKKKKWWKFWP